MCMQIPCIQVEAAAPLHKMQRRVWANSIQLKVKAMTKAIRVATLVLAFSISAHAGIMQTGKTEPPPPPPPATTSMTQGETETETLVEGIIQNDLTAAAASQAALATLQSLLTLF